MGTREVNPSQPRLLTPERASALVYALAMFMTIMDTQIVNVALPALSRNFHATLASAQWAITAYLMSIAVCVPSSGWLGDRFGTKKVFLLAVAAFTGASALCAVSASLPQLVMTRILQGIGGGMMVPTGMAMLYRAYPPARRAYVARLVTAVMLVAPATAPIIGGALVTWISWRWIFVINLPVGILATLIGIESLPEHREPPLGRFDLTGALLGGVGLGLLLYGVGAGPTDGWGSTEVLLALVIAIVALAAFVAVELQRPHPLMKVRLLSDRMLNSCTSLLWCQQVVFIGSLVFILLYLQEARGVSAINAGLSTFPEAIGGGITAQVVSRLFPRIGPRRLITISFVGLAILAGILSLAGGGMNLWEFRAVCLGLGVSTAFFVVPSQAAAFTQISSADTGHATAIYSTFQRAAGSLGIAILAVIYAGTGGDALHVRPTFSNFRWVFIAGVGSAILGVVLCQRIRDADAAAAMGRQLTTPARKLNMNAITGQQSITQP